MRLYRTPLGQWAGTQADARTFKATHGVDFALIEVPTDKAGLLAFLNKHEVGATKRPAAPELDTSPTPPSQRPTPLTEDAFEALPLPMQLHLATLALENARDQIKPTN